MTDEELELAQDQYNITRKELKDRLEKAKEDGNPEAAWIQKELDDTYRLIYE